MIWFSPSVSTTIKATPVAAPAIRRTADRSTPPATSKRQRLVGHGIVADGADQHDVGAQTPGGERLVRALAARGTPKGRTDDGLARPGQARRIGDQVEIDAADHAQPGHQRHPDTRSVRLIGR